MKIIFLFIISLIALESCNQKVDKKNKDGLTYVNPSIDKNGKFRKGHIRKSVSTDKNAIIKRAKSKYYYHTKGKYRKK